MRTLICQKIKSLKMILKFSWTVTLDLDYLKTGGISPRALLDSVVPDRPVVMLEETSHSVWVNSKALEKAGFIKGSPNPSGMYIKAGESNIHQGFSWSSRFIQEIEKAGFIKCSPDLPGILMSWREQGLSKVLLILQVYSGTGESKVHQRFSWFFRNIHVGVRNSL